MITNCINCGGTVDPGKARCIYCGTFYDSGKINPVSYFFSNRRIRKKAIYPVMIALGAVTVLSIYGLFFNRLSETMLINISPVWYFLLTFGLYGYHAEKLLDIIAANRAADIRSARKVWFNEEGRNPLVAVLAHFFFFAEAFVNKPWPALIALVGSLAWGFLLLVFLNGIFPSL